MLKRILKIDTISLILHECLWIFLLLTYFIVIASPNSLHMVKRSNSRISTVYKGKLTKDASSHSSTIAHLDVGYPDVLSGSNSDNKFITIPLPSERRILSVQPLLPFVSSNAEFPSATNLKRRYRESLKTQVRNSTKKLNKFLNVGTMNNLTGPHISEHDVNIRDAKYSSDDSDNDHSPVLENFSSSSNSSNSSNQSSFSASQLFENNSSVISVSLSTLDISFNSSNNTAIDTIMTNLTIFVTHPSGEITTDSSSSDGQGKRLTSGAIAGIVIVVIAVVIALTGTVIYLLYQKYGKSNKLESKCPSDNCGYVDDTLRSSGYLNSHIELPKESSEEMTSLDNDSFLNSLESMTFQNYWADNTKNTKV